MLLQATPRRDGSPEFAARMRTSTRSASGLVGILQAARDRVDPQVTQWVTSLIASKSSVQDVIIWTLVELFLGNEACNRMHLDIGQLFESATLQPREAVQRTNEMRKFLKAELAAQLQSLRVSKLDPSPVQLEKLMRSALELTFSTYENEP